MANSEKALDRNTARRTNEARQFQVYMVLGFVLFLPVVVVNRLLKWSWHGRRLPAAPRQRESIISETKAEVQSALAFVFMA